MTAFIDRPASSYATDVEFWAATTGSSVSAPRGRDREFATLIPPTGDAYLRVQRVAEGPGGTHIDLHTDDQDALVAAAKEAGAELVDLGGSVSTLRSPGGLLFCVVSHRGEASRPPRDVLDPASTVDQVSIDVGADQHLAEIAFWSGVLRADTKHSTVRDEFAFVRRVPGQPLRLMVQRCGATTCATAHLDWSCDDIDAAVALHVELGGTIVERFRYWTVMADPGGTRYCLTHRPVAWSYDDPEG